MDAPHAFQHGLDPDLFTLDRIEALVRRAPPGKAGVQFGDPGRERRPARAEPVLTTIQGSLADDIMARPLHVHMKDMHEWAPEYDEARAQVLAAAGVDPAEPQYRPMTGLRVFSPDVPVSYHGDPETQLNCCIAGRNLWHLYPPSSLSDQENEELLRGGQYLPWREPTLFADYDLHPGDGFVFAPRWTHWIEHPGPDPAVSFEVGYYLAADIRVRKVWDVNWLLRRAKLTPKPPGQNEASDRRKRQLFDALSVITRKGGEFRGL
jgi:hypothetical protein